MDISGNCIPVIEQHRCVGCGNCVACCPAGCFSMTTDPAGFVTAQINENFAALCKDCGLCKKFCPELQTPETGVDPERILCYSAWHKDRNVVLNSSSGGVFFALATAFLSQGGLVAGVVMKNNRAVYQLASEPSGLKQFQGSKYIPAEITGFYPSLTEALRNNKKVLISLLPCIAKAVRMRFHKYIINGQLVIIDFVCAGVPAPVYFRKEAEAGNITVDRFRFKDGQNYCWHNSSVLSGTENNSGKPVCISVKKSPFYNGFACDLILRKSCYNCHHAQLSRNGDITLADFWGEKRFPEQQKYGISLVMVNSEAGKQLLKIAENDLEINTASICDAAGKNPRLYFGKKSRQYHILCRNFSKIIKWAPLCLLNLLYGGGYRRIIFRKLPYTLLWPKKNKAARIVEHERQAVFNEIFVAQGKKTL